MYKTLEKAIKRIARYVEREGGCFEVTEIKLTGNNSRFKYNHHL